MNTCDILCLHFQVYTFFNTSPDSSVSAGAWSLVDQWRLNTLTSKPGNVAAVVPFSRPVKPDFSSLYHQQVYFRQNFVKNRVLMLCLNMLNSRLTIRNYFFSIYENVFTKKTFYFIA